MINLLLGVANSSCELPYFWILVPEYPRVEGIWMRVNITTAYEVNCYGKGQGMGDCSLGPESKPIEKSKHVWLGFLWIMARLSCVFKKLVL